MRHDFVRCASNDFTKPSKIFPESPPPLPLPLPFEMAGNSTTGICTFISSTIGSRCSGRFCCILGCGGGGGTFWLLEISCKSTSDSSLLAAKIINSTNVNIIAQSVIFNLSIYVKYKMREEAQNCFCSKFKNSQIISE